MIPNELPLRLRHIYSTPNVDQRVVIYSGQLAIEVDGSTLRGNGIIFFDWRPSPAVRWEMNGYTADGPSAVGISGERGVLNAGSLGSAIKVQVTNSLLAGGKNATPPSINGYIENGEGLERSDELQSVTFSLPNFGSFLGQWIRDEHGNEAFRSRAILEAAGWRVTLDGMPTAELPPYDARRGSGGSFITHVGKIEKVSKGLFSVNEVKELLNQLYWFFSFCQGRPVAPILPVGIGPEGEQIWSEWAHWRTSTFAESRNWFNDFSGEGLEKTFPGFVARMREPVWKEAAKMAVYWYVESQEVGSDSALIVIQAAFELLSWTWFVEDRKKYSRRDFNRLPTAVKLRLLLESAEIPTTIQSSLQELDAHAKSRGWADGPEALVGIRNALVHPTVRNVARIAATSAYSLFEASQLALWYLELILLYLFGFQGKYANRLVMNGWKGEEVSPVPWQSIPAA